MFDKVALVLEKTSKYDIPSERAKGLGKEVIKCNASENKGNHITIK